MVGVADARKRTDDEPDLTACYDAIVKRVLSVYPQAQSIRIVATGPDGKAGFPVPMGPACDDVESLVLAALGRLRPGDWMRGKVLAAELDTDRTNGNFNRVVSDLVKRGVIESNRLHGYRMASEQKGNEKAT